MLDVLKNEIVLKSNGGASGKSDSNLPEAKISVNIPIPKEANTVPNIFPTPPRTTTIKQGTILASFGIGILTDIFASGRLLSIFPEAPPFLFNTLSFFSTSSMAVVLIFSLIVVFLQFKPQGIFPQKGRTVE